MAGQGQVWNSQIAGVVSLANRAGPKYWPCNSTSSTVVLLVPSTISFVLERPLQRASKLPTSKWLKAVVHQVFMSLTQHNIHMCHITNQNYYSILFHLHPLFLTHRQWGEHMMVLALSLGSPESPKPCFRPLAVKGFFPLTWMSWVTLVAECFFCSDIILITLGNNRLAGDSGHLELWEKSEWSFILLHVAWLTLITVFPSV